MEENKNTFEYTQEAWNASLSSEERREMKENIRLFMTEYPVRLTFKERFFWHNTNAHTPVFYGRPALASFLIVLLVGGGTSYVAADALPGDLLYPIKTGLNENVQEALAFSEEAKANLNAKLAVRRLEEAEILASEGRLSPEVRADIEVRFEEHTEKFETKVASLAQREETVEIATDAQSDLETSLKTHAAVLADLSLVTPEAAEEVSPIVRAVERRAQSVESGRVASERTISRKVGKDIQNAAAAKKRIAEDKLSRTGSRERKIEADADTETVTATLMMATAEVERAPADEAFEEFQAGSERFEEGKYGEAYTKFQGAIRAVQRAKLDADVRKKLNIGPGTSSFTKPTSTSTFEIHYESDEEEENAKDENEDNEEKNDSDDEREEEENERQFDDENKKKDFPLNPGRFWNN